MEFHRRNLLKIAFAASAANIAGLQTANASDKDDIKFRAMQYRETTIVMLTFALEDTFYAILASGGQPFTPLRASSIIYTTIANARYIGRIYQISKVLVLIPQLVLSVASLRSMVYIHDNTMFEFRRPKKVKKSRHITFKPNEVKRLGKPVGKAYLSSDGKSVIYDCNT